MFIHATPKELEAAAGHIHRINQCSSPVCLWGFSNVKHRPHSGGQGKSARRAYLARGKKYWRMAREKK